MKKKWHTPKVKQIAIKKTSEIIIHNKEHSPNWS